VANKTKPRLMRSPLTHRVYVVTRYRVVDEARDLIEAHTKYDVTEDYARLRSEDRESD
jgi:hypothetical protein